MDSLYSDDLTESSTFLHKSEPQSSHKQACLQSNGGRTLFALTSLCLNIFLVGVIVWADLRPRATTSLHPLPGLSVKYQPRPYTDFEQSDFAGLPSPSLDKSWHDLLAAISLRISDGELESSNQSSVALPNGGNMAWLGVYHELHCIKMLRQWNYREHYHPNVTGEKESEHWDIHADHCFELLRSAALCHADTTLTTFRWDPDKSKPMLDTRLVPHQCVDWEVLMASVRHRVVSKEEVDAMENPLHSSRTNVAV